MKVKTETITIMVVDDERNIREASARILSKIGFQMLQASCGDEALETLEKNSIAIILLDLKMPGMDGMEVLRHVKKMDESVLVIVITGFATVETAIEAMKEGAYDFIPKPFEPDQLRIIVNRASERVLLARETAKLEELRRRTLADLDAEKSRLHTIVDSFPSGVMVTNSLGEAVLMNPAFKSCFNIPGEPSAGKPIEEYVADQDFCRFATDISGLPQATDHQSIPDYEFSAGGEKFFQARKRPIFNEKGECIGAVINVADITSLKLLDQLKNDFVAKVSHELRSPLSTIHEQLAKVMNDMVDGPSDQDQHILARAKEKTKTMISLIGDLLDLSRIEEGIICRDFQAVSIPEILKNITDFMRDRAKSRGQSLALNLREGDIPPVTADPIAVESIFGNLIANAINYTRDGGEIVVTADTAENNVRVKVADNGFGIEKRHLEKIFERFYRVKDEKTRYITGTGLGLPIVKGLVDAMDGSVRVESTPGEGTVFTVLIPVK